MKKFVEKHYYLLTIILTFTLVMSLITISRYNNFLTGYYDLGVFMNPLYNTLHGNFLLQYNVGTEINTLGTHQMYILLPLSLLYRIFPNAYFLLSFQSFIVGMGAVPIYLIGKELLIKKSLINALPILYLFTPTIQWTNIYDFHPETFTTTFILFLWYFLLKKQFYPALIFLVLTISCKEDMGLAAGAICLGFAIMYKNKKEKIFLVILSFLSITISLIEVQFLIPMFNTIHKSYFLMRYSYLGKSSKDILLNLLVHPKLLFHSLFGTKEKLEFLLKIFLQSGFLGIFSPVILVAFSQFGMDLLGSTSMHSIIYQYTTVINAVLWISTIYSIKMIFQILDYFKVNQVFKNRTNLFIVSLLVLSSLLSNYLYSPILSLKWFRGN